MSRKYVLIDFENVQPSGLGSLKPNEFHIKVFAGAHQNKVELGLAQALQPFGSDAEYIQVVGTGKDALDFHIAFYIGRLSMEQPGASFTIVSRDTGFDPLVKHLAKLGIACKRTGSISGSAQVKAQPVAAKAVGVKATKKVATKAGKNVVATVAPTKSLASVTASKIIAKVAAKQSVGMAKDRIKDVLERLVGLKAARPGTVKTLRSSLKAWFKPALSDAEVDALFDELSRHGKIKVSGTKVAYSLAAK